jgi:hypothetical protein
MLDLEEKHATAMRNSAADHTTDCSEVYLKAKVESLELSLDLQKQRIAGMEAEWKQLYGTIQDVNYQLPNTLTKLGKTRTSAATRSRKDVK